MNAERTRCAKIGSMQSTCVATGDVDCALDGAVRVPARRAQAKPHWAGLVEDVLVAVVEHIHLPQTQG